MYYVISMKWERIPPTFQPGEPTRTNPSHLIWIKINDKVQAIMQKHWKI
jgi:hypothetical protein